MVYITSPSILQTKDALGNIVVGANLALRFDNATVVQDGTAQTLITPLGGGGSGTVTSVGMTVPAFLSVANSPITTSGSLDITLSGSALPITSGGTGEVTANDAINALLPDQTGNNGRFLTTNGTDTSWAVVSGGPITGSINTVAFFNGLGNLDDNTKFAFDESVYSLWWGQTDGTSSIISSGGIGCLAHGYAENNSLIQVYDDGSYAGGYAKDSGGIFGNGKGAFAFGLSQNSGSITANNGSFAGGYCDGQGSAFSIVTTNSGALAFGCADGGAIQSSGRGSFAIGLSETGGTLYAFADGSFCGGIGPSLSQGRGSFVWGEQNQNSGELAALFGFQNIDSSYLSFTVGRYSEQTFGSINTWVSTDPLFVVGNGDPLAARNNAFQIDKDGKLKTTAAQKHTATRHQTGSTVLNARTDRSLFVDTSPPLGTVVTLPLGEEGLEFFIKDSTGNAAISNITFAATVPNLVDPTASITTNYGGVHLQFSLNTWYVMART